RQLLRDREIDRALGVDQLRLAELGFLALVLALLQRVCHGISHLPDWGSGPRATAALRRPTSASRSGVFAFPTLSVRRLACRHRSSGHLTSFSLPQQRARSARRGPTQTT